MEKVIITLRGTPGDEAWCTGLRTDAAQTLLESGLAGVAVNVRDDAVTDSLMTLTTSGRSTWTSKATLTTAT